MATGTTQKKPCCKCDKGGGIFTCDGCQQSFCRKHSEEHRQELAIQMDSIGQEYDVIQRDINKESDIHPLLSRIDVWERESIDKIQQVANQARVELNQLIDERKNEVKTTMSQLTNELQSSRQSEDYTEIDLKKWTNQLNKLRQDLEQSMNEALLDNDDQRSAVRLIKVRKLQQLRPPTPPTQTFRNNSSNNHSLIPVNHERFYRGDQEITLFENGLVSSYLGLNLNRSAFVFCARHYSTDTHRVEFRIEKKTGENFFFGIVTSSEMNPSSVISSATSVNGWWLDNYSIVNGVPQGPPSKTDILERDKVALIVDCDRRGIYLDHSRKLQQLYTRIDIQKCPFPWKIVVGLGRIGTCVRILD